MIESQTQNRRIVSVVDDDVSVRRSVCNLLRSLGHDAEGFASGEEFLQSLRCEKTDCLLLDVVMKAMGGLEVQVQMRARGQSCPVIFISANVDPATEAAVMRGGAIGYLTKPFGEERLLGLLKTAFDSRSRID